MFVGVIEVSSVVSKTKVPTGEVYTAEPVSKFSMNIQIRVPEPKAFDGEKQDAKSWLK